MKQIITSDILQLDYMFYGNYIIPLNISIYKNMLWLMVSFKETRLKYIHIYTYIHYK